MGEALGDECRAMDVAVPLADPAFMTFLGSLPLSRMAAFPGSPLTAETLEKVVAAANG